MSGGIVCSMPGCNTTAGCQCRNRAGISGWFGQIQKDAAASPTPPDFFAESANKSAEHHADSAYCSDAQVGLPNEEAALAAYNAVWQSAPGIDAHNVEIVRREAMAAVFDLIRPAFEAKERHIANALDSRARWVASTMAEKRARDAAEAKLAQAVEALEPFASYHEAAEFLDDKGHPLPDDQHAGYVYLTMGAFRRAAAAMGEKT